MKRTAFALALILFFVSLPASFEAPLKFARASPLIVVPNDYPTIQGAIDHANAGDTILVESGTYNEQALEITKSLSITSKFPREAKIVCNPPTHLQTVQTGRLASSIVNITNYDNAINIQADNVKLSGFVVTSPGGNIVAVGDNIQITNNIMGCDSWLTGSGENDTVHGALLNFVITGSNEIVVNNSVCWMFVQGSSNSVIKNSAAQFGLKGFQNSVADNYFTSGQMAGVYLDCADHNVFHNNNIAYPLHGGTGIYIMNGSYNLFYENLIEGGVGYISQISVSNSFDDGKTGNYWGDYISRYPNATEVDDSGIWNTPYVVGGNVTDNYPLINKPNVPDVSAFLDLSTRTATPSPMPTPQPESFPTALVTIVSGISLAIVGTGLLVYFKKRKRQALAAAD